MKRLVVISILGFSALFQLQAVTLKEKLDNLVSRGNRAYELNQRTVVKQVADSMALLMKKADMEGDELNQNAVSLFKLYGDYYYSSAKLDSAAKFYDFAIGTMTMNPNTSYGTNVVNLPREIAQLFYRQGKYDYAVAVLERIDTTWLEEGIYLPHGNDWLITKMTLALSLARTGRFKEAKKIAEEELEAALDKKSLDYARAQRMYAKIKLLEEADIKGALKIYKEYFKSQKEYALANFARMTARERSEYWQSLSPYITDCYALEGEDPEFLFNVALFSKGLLLHLEKETGEGIASRQALKGLEYTAKDISKKLKAGEAAIEFIEYEKNGEKQMAALLLAHDGKVRFIKISAEKDLDIFQRAALQSTDGSWKSELHEDTELQQQIWTDELLTALKGVKKLYFAPDGYLHLLAIEYMPRVKDKELVRLSSSRRLMQPKSKFKVTDPMLLFGKINYNLDDNRGLPIGNDTVAFSRYSGFYFPLLNELTDECYPIYEQRGNPADTIMSRSMASEYAFRQLAPRYSSILISTHGDFSRSNPVATDVKEIYGDNSLSDNIMVFAGTNLNLKGNREDYRDYCDGLLSASELAAMDLTDCYLFTISACQSGLGEITPDGVFGLQRALKKAGVDAMVLSLWNVYSNSTAQFMKLFYGNMEKGMSIRRAFQEARKALITGEWKKHEPLKEEEVWVFDPSIMAARWEKRTVPLPDYSTPAYTDAFILIDALD